MKPARSSSYDVLIVGSGASGGWVAKEVAERGLRVLMLEAGPPRVPTRDFTEHIWPYQLKFRGFGDQQRLLENQPVQRLCYACDDYGHQFFVNDHENPYTFPPTSRSCGFADVRSVDGRSAGRVRATGSAISISKRPAATATAKTGPSAIPISRPTTIAWNGLSASAARARGSNSFLTGNSFRQWRCPAALFLPVT